MSMALMQETEAMRFEVTYSMYLNVYRTVSFGTVSCTVVIGQSVLFFGGMYEKNQISQLSPLGLIRIGTLPFLFMNGACLVMDSLLFLGFVHPDNTKTCWSR